MHSGNNNTSHVIIIVMQTVVIVRITIVMLVIIVILINTDKLKCSGYGGVRTQDDDSLVPRKYEPAYHKKGRCQPQIPRFGVFA